MTDGERLAMYRKRANVRQPELSQALGVTTTWISLVESDKKNASKKLKAGIEEYLGEKLNEPKLKIFYK